MEQFYEMNKAEQYENTQKKKKKIKKIIAIILIILVIIACLLCFRQCSCTKEVTPLLAGDLFPSQGSAKDGTLSGMSEEEVRKQMQKAADSSYFSFKINARPIFEDGNSKGTLQIENPNYNTYPMVVEIYLNDSKELIYSSGGILPNQHIDTDKLSKELAAGEYSATAQMIAFDAETNERLGHQEVGLIITVQK